MQEHSDPQIRDFVEFYRAWPDGRRCMVDLRDSPALDEEQRLYVRWLIHLADRVGPADVMRRGN